MELAGGCAGKRYWLSPLCFSILAGLCLSSCIAVWGRELGRNDGWRTREGKAIGVKLSLRHRDFTAAPSSSSPASAHSHKSLDERLGAAMKRSWRRLEYFQRAVTVAVSGGGGSYELRVHAGEAAFVAAGAATGTPAVGFTALVDTGSDLVWRQCQPCTHCGGTIFDPNSSSTFHLVPCSDPLCKALPSTSCPSTPNCSYTYTYGDRSFTSGDLAYDTLTLPDSSSGQSVPVPTDIAFGCGHDNEFRSPLDADGLLGLGQGPLSLPSQLGLNEFSYCLQTITDPTSSESPLFLGPSDLGTSFNLSTPIITNPRLTTLYYIGLKGISVGGQLLILPSGTFDLGSDGPGGMIIDSGTTLTYLVRPAYLPLLQAFKNSISLPSADGSAVGLDLCYQTSGKVPSLTFHFDGGDLTLPTENYFITIQGLFCLAMGPSSYNISIFGNIQQQNFLIRYNRGAETLSFAPTTCDSL